MNKLFTWAKLAVTLSIFAICFLAYRAFAGDADPISTPDAFAQLWALMSTIAGKHGAGLALVLTQAVMIVFRSPIANFAGKYKLLVVYGLSCVVPVLTALIAVPPGGSYLMAIVQAVMSGTELAAIQVFIHQLVTQPTASAPKAA